MKKAKITLDELGPFLGISPDAVVNQSNQLNIESWINRIINGHAGFLAWEEEAGVIFNYSREEGIAEFVIRCLANPLCEGSREVLEAIIEHRKQHK